MSNELKRLHHHARTMAAQIAISHAQNLTDEQFRVFAMGFVEGVRDTLTAYADGKVAYNVIQGVADGASVPQTFFEKEVADFISRLPDQTSNKRASLTNRIFRDRGAPPTTDEPL